MKRILCYGDSNTWGYKPADGSRFSDAERWPVLMQKNLKFKSALIEEGLNGRSALNLYPGYDEANGIDYIHKNINRFTPLDLAIIFLGLNDIAAAPDEPLWKIAAAIEEIAEIIITPHKLSNDPLPQIILMGLPRISRDFEETSFYEIVINKVHTFPGLAAQSAAEKGYHFINTAELIETSPLDGTHLSVDAHYRLAIHTAEYINRIL